MTAELAALVDALLHGNESARVAAAQQIAGMGPQAAAALPALAQALSDQSGEVRALAAQALAQVGPQAVQAIPYLIQALSNADAQVQAAALDALKAITGQDFGSDVGRWQQWWQEQSANIAADAGSAGSGAPLDFPVPTQLDAWEAVEGGYRATILVRISGGVSPFVVQHDTEASATTSREYPLVFVASGCTLNHTIRVDSSDGQSVSHSYWIHAPWCD